MGNVQCFPSAPAKEYEYDVFINHRGKDVKDTIASLVSRHLQKQGRRVFLDKKSIKVGLRYPESIEQAIKKSSVHIVILSANFAESEWCLDELYFISKTEAPIIPVFYQVRPSDVRMEREGGPYALAFQKLSGRFKSKTLTKWKKALEDVSKIEGIIFEGNQGEQLEQIATCVSEYLEGKIFRPKAYHKQSMFFPHCCRIRTRVLGEGV